MLSGNVKANAERGCASGHSSAVDFKLHHYLLLPLIAIEQIYWAE
jgi:hypothetical protein